MFVGSWLLFRQLGGDTAWTVTLGLGALLRWGRASWRRWDLGVLLHCYAAMLGPRGDMGPRGTATLLYWGSSGYTGTSGYCYAAMLGPRGDMGPLGAATLLRWGSSGDAEPRGAATLGGLEETLGSRRRWCHWASCGCWCRWAPRRRWTSGDAGDAGLEETLGYWASRRRRRTAGLLLCWG